MTSKCSKWHQQPFINPLTNRKIKKKDQHIKNWNENADLLPEGHLQEGHLQEGCRLHKDVLIREYNYIVEIMHVMKD